MTTNRKLPALTRGRMMTKLGVTAALVASTLGVAAPAANAGGPSLYDICVSETSLKMVTADQHEKIDFDQMVKLCITAKARQAAGL